MALPTGKSLPHFLPHPLPTLVSRKLTDYPFTGRLILNSTNMGRKLHFLVSIIDTKDALICKAQRKGPSVCSRRRGASGKEGAASISVCPSAFLSEATCPGRGGEGGVSHSLPGAGSWAPATSDRPPSPSARQAGFKARHLGAPGQGPRLCRQPSSSFLPEALTTEKSVSLALW